jgi:hypothetical protein
MVLYMSCQLVWVVIILKANRASVFLKFIFYFNFKGGNFRQAKAFRRLAWLEKVLVIYIAFFMMIRIYLHLLKLFWILLEPYFILFVHVFIIGFIVHFSPCTLYFIHIFLTQFSSDFSLFLNKPTNWASRRLWSQT